MPYLTRFTRFLSGLLLCACALTATEYHGHVAFGGLPLPGATVTATPASNQGDKKFVATTNFDGNYSFPDLPDGDWHIEIEMLCFEPVKRDVTIAFGVPTAQYELKLLPADQIRASATAAPPPQAAPALTTSAAVPASASAPVAAAAKPGKKGKNAAVAPANTPSGFQKTDVNASATPPPPDTSAPAQSAPGEMNSAADSFAINGSVNNGAASPFGQSQAFGNNRRGPGSLYNGAFQLVESNSALNAENYSTTGQNTPKPSTNLVTFGFSIGGPVYIPHLIKRSNQPWFFFVGYQLTRNRNATTVPGLVPTADQRAGIFAQAILDPTTGNPFANNTIPQNRLSPQALALLSLFPLPNFAGSSRYNYQTNVRSTGASDGFQSRLNKTLNRSNQLSFQGAYQNSRNQNANLFAFLDHTNTEGFDVNGSWNHRFTQRLFMTYKLDFSRQTTDTIPFFENKENVSGAAGITGNNQNPLNWGPPNLGFASISGLSDAQQAANRNQTTALTLTGYFIRAPHNFTFGADYKRQQFNSLSQQNARGSFSFTGAATGSDLGDFLLGVPDAASIAFGNADKYFRSNIYDAYVTDDWRLSPGFTLNIGMRYEYSSPISELYGRLVNLDIASGYGAEVPVLGSQPTGPITGQRFPSSLVRPDKMGFEPRVGIAWRPISGSSLVVRAGYGVNYNTSVYQSIATQMAQQSPLSKSFSVQNSAAEPLTLANGFNITPTNTPNTFAIDPNFRVGYTHSWNATMQRDLPFSLVMNAAYLGIKGTRGVQEFYPNTYPSGAINPCPACPAGYAYMTSNGNSTHEEGKIQLRRRLHNGFTAQLIYTYSKSIDDAALGGRGQGAAVIAQNWLNLAGERGLSPFDQRHVVNFNMQYTTGVGTHGGMLMEGWRGTLFKEWTVTTTVSAGTGLPLNPTYFGVTNGTGCTSCLRGSYTGASLYDAPAGLFLNPAAVTTPTAGQWGNAGRNSIEGPDQFSLNAQMARTFRFPDKFNRVNMDVLVNSNNALNHVNYTSWITQVNSLSFGAPAGASGMRTMQATLRVRF
jgi:hypothetical protein